MSPSRYFWDLTQPEIAEQFQRHPLVILPAGSVEQHGPHLSTGTDIFASNIIGHAVAERMDGLVLPGPALGVTPMHMPFEGTLTLTPETYMRVVTETCASTAKHGARYLLILNWHEGNIPSLAIAAEDLHRTHGMTVLTVQACYVAADMFGHECNGLTHGGEIEALASIAAEDLHRTHGMTVLTVQACYVAADMFGHECNGLTHGGEIEALAVLAYRPELVHLDRIDYSSDAQYASRMDKLRRTRTYQPVLTDIRSIAPTGWYGTPQKATAERGVKMLEKIADAIAAEATEIFRQLDNVQGGVAEVKHLRQAG